MSDAGESERTSVGGVESQATYRGAAAPFFEAVDAGAPVRRQLWGLADVLVALLLSLLVPSIVVGFIIASGAPKNGTAVILASLVSPWVGFGIWPVLATRRRGNGPVIDLGLSFRRADLQWGVIGGLGALAVGSLVALITEHFTGPFDSAAGDAISNANVPRWVVVLFAVLAVVGAPFMEELCFRGLTFAALAKFADQRGWSPIPIASVVSAVLFAAVHLEPIRFPLLLSIGLVLAVVRAKTGRIGPTILAHGINNLIPVIGLLSGSVFFN
jgi:membrane protease YdiL (CAAX protease family)